MTVLFMMVVIMGLLAVHFFITRLEVSTSTAQADSTSGFYSAEAGLNLRGEEILSIFRTDNLPHGESPSDTAPCTAGNTGSGDFECQEHSFNNREVMTYVVEDDQNEEGGTLTRIPPNELFGGLNALENRYSVFSRARHASGQQVEALLEMIFRSRLVPIFQFAAFYNKDLEINPGPDMTLNGRVHSNGNLYLGSQATLSITGQVTVAKLPGSDDTTNLYRRRKDSVACDIRGTVVIDDLNAATGPTQSPERLNGSCDAIPQSTLNAWNGQIQTGLETLTVPPLRSFEPGGEYWQRAELRLVLVLDDGPPRIEARAANNVDTVESNLTNTINACASPTGSNPAYPGSAGLVAETSETFYNWREHTHIRMLEIDVAGLMNCVHQNQLQFGFSLDDLTHGGLVWFFTVEGDDSDDAANSYGIRLRNAATLGSTLPGAPNINGLTVVSDQAVYLQGDYNCNSASCSGGSTSNWRPASVIADSLNVLSEAYNHPPGGVAFADGISYLSLGSRDAQSTEVNAAFLSGTDSTGNREGGGWGGAYNGGLENYPRFHEDWSGRTLRYRGSFVSFDRAQHVNGTWCGTGGSGTLNAAGNEHNRNGCNIYNAPTRHWEYDERFNNINQLPPLSPNFVYLKQELFVRDFERDE
ncbi:MAG: hypothetical protein WDA03_10355 [Trueperaceae bacterium]